MKLFILYFATLVALNAAFPQQSRRTLTVQDECLLVMTSFDAADIVPDIIPEAPTSKLGVLFETVQAELGNLICPLKTILRPEVEYEDADPQAYYTLIILDCDVPSRDAPILRCYIISLCVNINGSALETWGLSNGFPVAPYVSPSPTPGSGKHRIIALLYQQAAVIDVNNRALIMLGVTRVKFDVTEFASNYTLGAPVAGNFWLTSLCDDYERYSDCSAACEPSD